MKIVGVLVILIVVTFGYTQAPDTLWTRTYGGTGNDVGNSIKQTSDGGYIIAGYTESFGAGGQDVWLLKTDANGDTIWTKTYGGADDDWAEDVQLTDDGGFIIAANTASFVSYSSTIWLIKTDSHGNPIWIKVCDHWWLDEGCSAVQQTSDGGYIIAGWARAIFYETVPLLMKTNEVGDTVWTYTLEGQPGNFGSISHVLETYDGGFITAGRIGDYGKLPWLAKFAADGDTLWNKTYYYYPYGGWLGSVEQISDGGFIACGCCSHQDYLRLYVIRTDSEGDTLWRSIFDDSLFWRSGNSGKLTNDNGYIVTGGCGSVSWWETDLLLIKMGENGDSLWSVAYGDSGYGDVGNDLLQTIDNGYIIVGSTESYGAGGSDVWLIKTEPDVGVEENEPSIVGNREMTATIFHGPLKLPEGRKCKVFDITGRVVEPNKIQPGIYFIEIDGVVTQKVVKVR